MKNGDQICVIKLSDEGDIDIYDSSWNIVMSTGSQVVAGLGLYDEARENFDWREDSERVLRIMSLQLEIIGLEFADSLDALAMIASVCEPGPGGQPNQRYIMLRPVQS